MEGSGELEARWWIQGLFSPSVPVNDLHDAKREDSWTLSSALHGTLGCGWAVVMRLHKCHAIHHMWVRSGDDFGFIDDPPNHPPPEGLKRDAPLFRVLP